MTAIRPLSGSSSTPKSVWSFTVPPSLPTPDSWVELEPEVILAKLRQALDLCWFVLSAETVGSLRSKEIETPSNVMWAEHPEIFRGGIRKDADDSSRVYITLETTFLHRYYEYIAHLNNIQRLKKAQGLGPAVEIPFEGYWALPDWDRSEP